jgi:hypothetical protein
MTLSSIWNAATLKALTLANFELDRARKGRETNKGGTALWLGGVGSQSSSKSPYQDGRMNLGAPRMI